MTTKKPNLKGLLTGKGGIDSRGLEEIFKNCRLDEDKMRKLIRAFCSTYLIDGKQRPLLLRPLQEEHSTTMFNGKEKMVNKLN